MSTFLGIFGDIFEGIRDVKGHAAVQRVSLATGAVQPLTPQVRSRLFRQLSM